MEERKKDYELRSEMVKIAHEKLKLKREKLGLGQSRSEESTQERLKTQTEDVAHDGGVTLPDLLLKFESLMRKCDYLEDVLKRNGLKWFATISLGKVTGGGG